MVSQFKNITVLGSLITLLFSSACQQQITITTSQATESIQANALNADVQIPGHLKYFGFYASSAPAWGIERTQHIKDFSNVSWIAGLNTSAFYDLYYSGRRDPNLINQVLAPFEDARRAGLFVVATIDPFFFDGNFNLRPDYQNQWNLIASLISKYVYDGTIIGFYNLDEPYTATKLKVRAPGHRTPMSVYSDITTLSNTVKATFPSVPMMLNLTSPDVASARVKLVPATTDWVSFDVYDCWASCGGLGSYTQLYNRLERNLRPYQRTFLIPDTWKQRGTSGDTKIGLFNNYVKLAVARPRVVGIFNFIYQNLPQKGGGVGLESLPSLRTRVVTIGQKFRNNLNHAAY